MEIWKCYPLCTFSCVVGMLSPYGIQVLPLVLCIPGLMSDRHLSCSFL
jgi:hypothetical protein